MVDHVHHLALAQPHHLGDGAHELLGSVHGDPLEGLVEPAVDLAGDHLRLAHREFETLSTHELHQNGELQLTASLHLPLVRAIGGVDEDRDIADELLVQAGLEQACSELVAGTPRQRRGVDAERHGHRRLVNVNERQGRGVLRVGEGLTDGDLRDTGDGDDVTGPRRLCRHPFQGLGLEEFGQPYVLHRSVPATPGNHFSLAQLSGDDAAQRQTSQVRGSVEVGDVCLEHPVLLVAGSRDVLDDAVEEGLQVGGVGHLAVGRLGHRGPAGLGGGVDDRHVEQGGVLVLRQIHEQVVGLLDDLVNPGIGAIHLVDDEDEGEFLREGLAQDETGLGQGSLGGVDEQDDAVDHLQAAFDLTAEVGVTRGVDDVEGDLLVIAHAMGDGRVLGQDGDALLTLEVHRVHDARVDVGTLAECAGLPQHCIDEGRLSVVDVGHNGDIAQIIANGHEKSPVGRRVGKGMHEKGIPTQV